MEPCQRLFPRLRCPQTNLPLCVRRGLWSDLWASCSMAILKCPRNTINHADRYWTQAIDRPGAFQVGYLKRLIESHAAFDRVPDQSLILDGQGEQSEYVVAFHERNNQCAMVYLPVGKKIVVNTGFVGHIEITISWFNPRNGKIEKKMNLKNEDSMSFDPPTTGSGNDWVLIIEKI